MTVWLLAHAVPVALGGVAGAAAGWLAATARARRTRAPRRPTPGPSRVPTGVERRLSTLEERNLELVRLFVLLPELGRALAGTTDREELTRLLVAHTQELFPDAAAVGLFSPPEEPGASLRLVATAGAAGAAGAAVPAGAGLVGHAFAHGEVATPGRLRHRLSRFELEEAVRDDPTPFPVWAAVPVVYGDRVHGVLALAHPGAFWTRDDAGAPDPLKLLGVLADVGAIALTYSDAVGALEASNEKLRSLDRLKSEFVSMVSHDLRTPLSSVRSALENLRDGVAGPLSERQQEVLALMGRETGRLLRLINSLLDLQRIEAGGVKLQALRLFLRPLVERTMRVLAPALDGRGVRVDLERLPGDLAVHADPERLSQVLFNLLDNAAKFTPEGGVVAVEGERRDDLVVVAVVNSGEPISAADAEAIFESFHQVRRADGSRPPGAGLGLAIARKLVGLHGGGVWARGIEGVGTRFAFSLPVPEGEV